jgi:hypothetical protein
LICKGHHHELEHCKDAVHGARSRPAQTCPQRITAAPDRPNCCALFLSSCCTVTESSSTNFWSRRHDCSRGREHTRGAAQSP